MAGAYAQSLGEPAAELWIGRPLEVTVPARFASADSRDTCLHAEVSYGDTRLAPSRVRTTLLGDEEHRRVRITTDLVVDEPLVTVTLRAGCTNTLTRSYTLLPDMPSEAVLARLLQPEPAIVALSAPPAPVSHSIMAARPEPRALAARAIPMVARPAAAPRPRAASAFRAAARVPASRLRLEAIEADTSALLRVSANLAQPAGDAGQRATAAVLWQALNATPEEVMRSTAALQKLETELAHLRLAAGQTRAEMAALRKRLDEPRPWYSSPRAGQALILLVLIGAASSVLLARRTRRQPVAAAWYAAGRPASDTVLEVQAPGMQAPQQAPAEAPPMQRHGQQEAPPQTAFAPSEPAFAPSQPAALLDVPASQPPEPASVDLEVAEEEPRQVMAAPPASGLLRVETLAATLEEVDFLAALGLHSDAMDVLKAYLADSASPAPVAFFELMRVCGLADDPQAVEAVRRRYAKVFGQPAPRLEQVTAPAGLEAHSELKERVTARWGKAAVLPVIEQALFGTHAGEAPLTLQTARDLISLYDVAMLLVAEDQAAAAPGPVQEQPLAPWAHPEPAHEAHAVAHAVADDFSGHRFGLDIDLTVAPQPLAQKPPQPDAQELAARLLAEKEAAARQAAARAAAEAEEAFNAAVASERAPLSRF